MCLSVWRLNVESTMSIFSNVVLCTHSLYSARPDMVLFTSYTLSSVLNVRKHAGVRVFITRGMGERTQIQCDRAKGHILWGSSAQTQPSHVAIFTRLTGLGRAFYFMSCQRPVLNENSNKPAGKSVLSLFSCDIYMYEH